MSKKSRAEKKYHPVKIYRLKRTWESEAKKFAVSLDQTVSQAIGLSLIQIEKHWISDCTVLVGYAPKQKGNHFTAVKDYRGLIWHVPNTMLIELKRRTP